MTPPKKHRSAKKNSFAANEVRHYAPRAPRFSFFCGRVGVLEFCCSQCVPIKFSKGFQHVPQVFNVFLNMFLKLPMCFFNMFPIAPHFIIISFALSSTLVTYIEESKGGDYNISILGLSKA
jgi:hypothetical protein